jgi:hypothetical protein
MMSAAVAMTVGVEPESVHSATSDRRGNEGMTFAQSFGERAGLSTGEQVKGIPGKAATELQEGNSTGASKISDGPSVAPGGLKGKAIDGQAPELNDFGNGAKSPSGTKNDFMSTVVSAHQRRDRTVEELSPMHDEMQGTATKSVVAANSSPTKVVAEPEDTVKDAPPADVDMPAADPKDVVPDGSAPAALDRTLKVSDEAELPVEKQTALSGNAEEMAVSRKTGTVQEHAKGSKVSPKTVGTTEHAKGIAAEVSGLTGVQGEIPVPVQVSVTVNAQPSEAGKMDDSREGISETVKSAVGTVTKATEGIGRSEVASGGKSEAAAAVGTDKNSEVSKPASSGFGEEIAGTVAAEKDSDGKMQNAAATALIHAATASDGTATGFAAGVTPGHETGVATGIRVQGGEAAAHANGQRVGSEEQDGAGTAVTEMGAMHRTLLATPTALEVGLVNGTEGWLKIRAATAGGGVVNASLSSATLAGQEMLHRELPGLTAYLQAERVVVNTVVVHANPSGGSGSGLAGGVDGGERGQAQQRSRQEGGEERQPVVSASLDRADDAPIYVGLNGVREDGSLSAGRYAGGGSWLNVRV